MGWKIAFGFSMAAGLWWLVRRVWLVKEVTEAEPPAASGVAAVAPSGRPLPQATAPPDPVDEAIAESFPASDPPSFAGARGHEDVGR